MPIIVCEVIEARPHENAERLCVYQVSGPGVDPTQIVANNTTVYVVGDRVYAALVNTRMADGTLIEKGKLRGIQSFGMLCGKATEALGTDVTAQMGATTIVKTVDESSGVVEESQWPRYTSLEGYLRVRDNLLLSEEVVVTEKIHGCFSEDTKVMLPNGEERSIREIVSNPEIKHVLTFDNGVYRPGEITGKRCLPSKGETWIRLTLENGRTVVCTAHHPILSKTRGYIRADDIQEGEDIESPIR